MKRLIKIVAGIGTLVLSMFFIFFGCSGVGTGGTGNTGGTNDTDPPQVVQMIPPDQSTNIDPGTIIVLFFNDALVPSTVTTSSVQVTESGAPIAGQLFLSQSQTGNTIVVFVPSSTLPVSSTIDINLPSSGGVQDDDGHELEYPFPMSFQTASSQTPAFTSGNWGFETDDTGFSIAGDGARLNGAQEDISPNEGSWMAAISSGEDGLGGGVVSGTEALFYTTSVLTTGNIATGGNTTLKFDYDFVSAEFNEFVGSEFDDTFLIAIRGSTGVHSEVVTSVNRVGTVGNVPITLPTSFTDADSALSDAGRTGWKTKPINISSLGSPISISFSVSDVSDEILTTVVFIDNIRFE